MKQLGLLLLLLGSSIPQSPQADVPVIILFPRFDTGGVPGQANGTLGRNASTILGLQTWTTLQTPAASDKAIVWWQFDSDAPKSPAEAIALAQSIKKRFEEDAQLIVWGKASEYGKATIVEPRLLIRRDGIGGKLGTDIWSATILAREKKYTFSIDVPSWQYEFAPIVLSNDLVPGLSDPAGLQLYAEPDGNKLKGNVGQSFQTSPWEEGFPKDFAPVRSGGTKGWVHLPDLSKDPSEVVQFCGGVMWILRKQWKRSVDMFDPVVRNKNTPVSVKIDAYLYMAIAFERMGDNLKSRSLILEAYKLNPFQKKITQYLCMSHLSHLARLSPQGLEGDEARETIASLKVLLSRNAVLFAPGDVWLAQVTQFLADVAK